MAVTIRTTVALLTPTATFSGRMKEVTSLLMLNLLLYIPTPRGRAVVSEEAEKLNIVMPVTPWTKAKGLSPVFSVTISGQVTTRKVSSRIIAIIIQISVGPRQLTLQTVKAWASSIKIVKGVKPSMTKPRNMIIILPILFSRWCRAVAWSLFRAPTSRLTVIVRNMSESIVLPSLKVATTPEGTTPSIMPRGPELAELSVLVRFLTWAPNRFTEQALQFI